MFLIPNPKWKNRTELNKPFKKIPKTNDYRKTFSCRCQKSHSEKSHTLFCFALFLSTDLYVKLYVVNIATQKRIIKKKTRVCRHDREPSFNETFRFCMNPTGHALQVIHTKCMFTVTCHVSIPLSTHKTAAFCSFQLFLVSNGGKFVKKTLIGEAYVWLDKVDLRKRVVSWHKLLASTAQIHS